MHIFRQYFGTKDYKAETFGFVIFLRQNIGKKAACKMLVKLTTGISRLECGCVIWALNASA